MSEENEVDAMPVRMLAETSPFRFRASQSTNPHNKTKLINLRSQNHLDNHPLWEDLSR